MTLAADFNDEWKKELSGNANFYDFIDGFELEEIYNNVIGEWRWGTEHEAVVREPLSGDFMKIRWRESSGDAEIDAYDMNVNAIDVRPKEVTKTVYVPV